MKLINKEKLPSLDLYILLAEFREKAENRKKLFKSFIDILLSALFFYFTIKFNVGFITCAIGFVLCSFYRFKELNNSGYSLKDLFKKNQEDEDELEKYYTYEYKEYLALTITEDENNYNKTVDAQLQSSFGNNCILGLDETVSVLASQVESYYNMYLMPKSVMTNNEWDTLFDSIFILFEEKEITSVFYQTMGAYLRDTLATILVKKRTTLSLSDFVDNINVINNLVADTTPVSFTEEDINILKRQIEICTEVHRIDGVRKSNVVNFNDYKKKTLK